MEAKLQEIRIDEKSGARRRWGWVGGGCAILFLALITGGMMWWQYVSYVPPVSPPQAAMPVPNARDDYLAAIRLLPTDSADQIKELYGSGPATGDRYPVTTPRLRQILQDMAPALKQVRVGLGHEFMNPPVVSYSQMFPELAEYRQLARLLAAESELALREGRPDAALRSGLDAVKLGAQVPRGGALIHGLVGIAIGSFVLPSAEETVDSASAEACGRAARELWDLDESAPTFADTLTSERDGGIVALAELCRTRNPREFMQSFSGNAGGAPNPSELGMMLQFAITPKRKTLQNYRRYLDAEIARARKPFYARGAVLPKPTDPINAIMAPMFTRADFSWDRQQALRRLLAARLAVRAYTLREGHPPASLPALVPKYLPAVPRDPFAPAPLVYRVAGGKPVVYSRGPDGDDDGGHNLGSRVQATSNGDLVSTRRPPLRSKGGPP